MNIVQFPLSRDVADAGDLSAIKARARLAGVEDVRFGYNDKNAPSGHTRVTCSIAMARYLLEELRVMAGDAEARGKRELLINCAKAVNVVMTVLEHGDADPAGGITGPPK